MVNEISFHPVSDCDLLDRILGILVPDFRGKVLVVNLYFAQEIWHPLHDF